MSVNATSLRDSVDAKLAEFFASRRAVVDSVGGGYPAAVADLEAFVLRGGKRMRPAFAWTAWLGAGGEPTGDRADAVLRACSALELIQACALIHDDIIDSSRTRRGFPTVHVGFAQRHRDAGWSGSADHFGVSAAVLVGDLALCWADDMLRESGIDTDAARRAQPVWSAMRTEVLGGQLLDIEAEAGTDESVAAAMRVNRYKTAAYTVERPLHLGAVLAGAGEPLTAAYRSFGADIGIAFQLRDDLLDVYGDQAKFGKRVGGDIVSDKKTYLLLTALERASATQKLALEKWQGVNGSDEVDGKVQAIKELYDELDIQNLTQNQINHYFQKGLHHLNEVNALNSKKELLRLMAIQLIERDS